MSEAEAGDAGFTLAEMLVVLALLALAATAAASSFANNRPAGVLSTVTDQLVADLQRTRIDAMRLGRMRHLAFDAGERRWQREGAAPVPLPDGVGLDLTTAGEARLGGGGDSGAPTIAFLPDGRSTGGRVSLRLGGGERRVEVNWLTGAVRREGP
ncbi:GspH/FimT family pseudopilin [Aureimonas ureilytica]|uniref:GspH/FimT family pseudopilin n=1 Tax=Aureimonas ureilytica TaxID=401562 RepID=UPI0003790AC2|nr:GspH/FimT family pseudopilin [Aureimonas ureilytica]